MEIKEKSEEEKLMDKIQKEIFIHAPNNNLNKLIVSPIDYNHIIQSGLEILRKKEGMINILDIPATIYNKTYKKDEEEKFLKKLNKILYFGYQSNFNVTFGRYLFTKADSGWGCMIRAGQMIMARGIYKYFKGKKVNTANSLINALSYFYDNPYIFVQAKDTLNNMIENYKIKNNLKNLDLDLIYPPFSIRIHCLLGQLYNKFAGEWFSDVNLSRNFEIINNNLNVFPDLKIFGFQSEILLYKVIEKCFEETTNNQENIYILKDKKYIFKNPGIIYISTRLGINEISEEYYGSIKKILNYKLSLGALGGKPAYAHYFIGYNDKGLLYLDPHTTKEAIDNLNERNIVKNYFTKTLHNISINQLATALTFGFIFRNYQEFIDLFNFIEILNKDEYHCFGLIKEKIEFNLDEKYGDIFNDVDDF